MKVYFFWESLGNAPFPPYLELCIETWRRNIPDANVILVNHDNLAQLSNGTVNVDQLKSFTLPLQSDIAAVAVMAASPGLFLDVDTLILPGFRAEAYTAWLTMYGDPSLEIGGHATNFFLTTMPGNPVLLSWLEEANRRIKLNNIGWNAFRWAVRRHLRGKSARVGWNYLGNSILDPLLMNSEMRSAIELRDRASHGYTLTPHFVDRYEHISDYTGLWYDKNIPVDDVFSNAVDGAVGLQHSWSPAWYSSLTQSEVLQDPHLISRTIAKALS